MLGHFGGVPTEITPPELVRPRRSDRASTASSTRSSACSSSPLAIARRRSRSVLLIKRTRIGMIIRAGVDDRADGLGARHQHPARLRDRVLRSARCSPALGGVLGGTTISATRRNDATYLLISLIVVIIGGMGSLGGAAIGAAAARPRRLLRRRLPAGRVRELLDLVLTFALLVAGARGAAARALREAGVSRRPDASRPRLVVAVVGRARRRSAPADASPTSTSAASSRRRSGSASPPRA